MPLFDDTRAAWGARPPRSALARVAPSARTEFMVHYDGGAPIVVATHGDCLARVRQDQTFHMDSNGWADIGYNGLVCQHGRAIEGRGADYAGAHCPDHNTPAYGWQFMVGGTQVPTPVAYARMARALADCQGRSGRALRKLGHRDGFATACPGTAVYAWVKAGMPAPTTTAKEDDMPSVDDVWNHAETNPVTGQPAQVGDMLRTAMKDAYYARQLAGQTLGIVKALAAKPQGLTAAEVAAAAKAGASDALDDKIAGATTVLNVKGA